MREPKERSTPMIVVVFLLVFLACVGGIVLLFELLEQI